MQYIILLIFTAIIAIGSWDRLVCSALLMGQQIVKSGALLLLILPPSLLPVKLKRPTRQGVEQELIGLGSCRCQ